MSATNMTVAKLKEFVRSSIEMKNSDKQVADVVSKVRLTEKFSLADLGELQNGGVGPKTLNALSTLVTQSANLPAPGAKAKPAVANSAGPAPPTEVERRQVLDKTREWALDYVKSLPDFVCLEDTQRYVDPHFQHGTEGSWAQQDRVIEKLTFFDHKENYELFQHNDTLVVNKSSESLGGARSTGEWASLLGEIFEPSSHTTFRWAKWATVRGALTYEFDYSVERQYSQEVVAHGNTEKVITAFDGKIFIERGTNKILRITVTPEIPSTFPVQDVDQIVDYGYQAIGDEKFLLPLKSTVTMRDGQMGSRNDIRWLSYRRYSADTVIKFDDPDAGQTQPQPQK